MSALYQVSQRLRLEFSELVAELPDSFWNLPEGQKENEWEYIYQLCAEGITDPAQIARIETTRLEVGSER